MGRDLRAPRSNAVDGAPEWPSVTAVDRSFWHAWGTGRLLSGRMKSKPAYELVMLRTPPCHLEAWGLSMQVAGAGEWYIQDHTKASLGRCGCCTKVLHFLGGSSQRPLICRMRLCCRNKSSTLRSVLVSV